MFRRIPQAALVALLAFVLLGGFLIWQNVSVPDVVPTAIVPASTEAPTDLAATVPAGGLGAAPTEQECDAAFAIVEGPAIEAAKSELRGIEALSANDVWAVGIAGGETLIEHWDGSAWTRAETPNPGVYRRVDGISATGPDDVWAVGWYDTGNSTFAPLVLHWDGSEWSHIEVPGRTPDSRLFAVSALAPDNVWAVGSSNGSIYTMNWDGEAWGIVSTPDAGRRAELNGVVAIAEDDVWAVGGAGEKTPTLHWDGNEWSVVPSPNAHNYDRLYAISALGSDDVWAAGGVVLHWNGTEWAIADSSLPEGQAYRGIAAFAPDNIWTGGYGKEAGGVNMNFVKRWDGAAWTAVDAVNPSEEGNQINTLGGTPDSIWAIGNQGASQTFTPMIQRYTDPCAEPAPTEEPTGQLEPPVALPGDGTRTFDETGKTVSGIFLDYWNEHGGLAQQGFPVSDVIGEKSDLDGKVYTVQYFQRAVFEYHPENEAPYNILLSQLGTYQYRQKYPEGAPDQTPNTSDSSILFGETGKRVGGRFLEYWNNNGGLAQQGYPISDEFMEESDVDGETYLVQYFERAVFEYHPENSDPFQILLSLLGAQRWIQKYSSY